MNPRYAVTLGALPGAAVQAPGLYHACLTDPPYELGFMGRQWDKSGVSFQPETWAAVMDRLYPGAFGLTFGGSRTSHRIATAIEDAGAIIHPTIYAWVYSSGFPKATRIDTQLSNNTEVIDEFKRKGRSGGIMGKEVEITRQVKRVIDPEFVIWEGHRYGLQAMRPALEPIILWQKPYPKRARPADSIHLTGAGTLHIEGCRKARGARVNSPAGNKPGGQVYQMGVSGMPEDAEGQLASGGWPCNCVLIHRPDCRDDQCAEGCPVPAIDGQVGTVKNGVVLPHHVRTQPKMGHGGVYGELFGEPEFSGYGDEGKPSELYFETFDWSYDLEEQIGTADAAVYSSKAGTDEKNRGIEGPAVIVDDGRNKKIDNPYLRGKTERVNTHPTVKPLTLCTWLARLLLPPPKYERRLLVPFSGSGSEMIGSLLSGWEYVHGIELRDEAVNQSLQRLEYWTKRSAEALTTEPKAILKSKAPDTGGRNLLDRIKKG